MFERFTEHARRVLAFAQEEAGALQHDYVGTGHVLLGLLREEEGLAVRVLDSFGITTGNVRTRVAALVGSGEGVAEQIPLTPTAKEVVERSLDAALCFGDDSIGVEHILLALMCFNDSLAVQILSELGADATAIRDHVTNLLSAPGGHERPKLIGWPGRSAAARRCPAASLFDGSAWLDGFEELLGVLEPEIQDALGRAPDVGDLLLTLACAEDSLPGRALALFGVDLNVLWGAIESSRAEATRAQTQARQACTETFARQTEVHAAKEQAIEALDFKRAAMLRDEESRLARRARIAAIAVVDVQALARIRRLLGLPYGAPPGDTTATSQSDS